MLCTILQIIFNLDEDYDYDDEEEEIKIREFSNHGLNVDIEITNGWSSEEVACVRNAASTSGKYCNRGVGMSYS